MSTGGVVIGPFSYLTAKNHEPSVITRGTLAAKIPQEKKNQVLTAVKLHSSENEIAAGIGVDFFALKEAIDNQDLTWGEFFTQFLGVLGDAGVYAAAGSALKQGVDKLSDPKPYNLTINGNGTTIIVGNQAPTTIDNSRTESEDKGE